MFVASNSRIKFKDIFSHPWVTCFDENRVTMSNMSLNEEKNASLEKKKHKRGNLKGCLSSLQQIYLIILLSDCNVEQFFIGT